MGRPVPHADDQMSQPAERQRARHDQQPAGRAWPSAGPGRRRPARRASRAAAASSLRAARSTRPGAPRGSRPGARGRWRPRAPAVAARGRRTVPGRMATAASRARRCCARTRCRPPRRRRRARRRATAASGRSLPRARTAPTASAATASGPIDGLVPMARPAASSAGTSSAGPAAGGGGQGRHARQPGKRGQVGLGLVELAHDQRGGDAAPRRPAPRRRGTPRGCAA